MRKLTTVGLAACGFAMLAGCNIAGTWRTVSIQPPEYADGYPFSQVTFSDDGNYTASATRAGVTETSVGKYTWDGGTLTITPSGGETRTYSGYFDSFKDQLVISHDYEGQSVSAAMEKQPE